MDQNDPQVTLSEKNKTQHSLKEGNRIQKLSNVVLQFSEDHHKAVGRQEPGKCDPGTQPPVRQYHMIQHAYVGWGKEGAGKIWEKL